jgi:hypothetical protein
MILLDNQSPVCVFFRNPKTRNQLTSPTQGAIEERLLLKGQPIKEKENIQTAAHCSSY